MSDGIRIGMTVQASDGEAGVVEDILTDEQGTPRFLVVRDKGVFGGDAVLPIDRATVQGGGIQLAMTRADVHAADGFSQEQYGEAAGLFSQAASRYDRQG